MKTQEKQVLFIEKIKEGKSEEIANQEIENDIECCKKSKKIIHARLIDTKKLKDKLNKKFKESFKKLTHKRIDDTSRNKCLIRRILNRLNEGPCIETKLAKDCLSSNKKVQEILSKLIKENKVKILEIKARGTIYTL